MNREIFEQRLAALDSRQESQTTELVEEYRKDLVEVQDTALRFAQSGGPQAPRAHSVVAQLGETVVEPLTKSIPAQKPVPDPSFLIDLVKGVVLAETAISARLKAALQDTRIVPQPPGLRAMEEVGPPYRVCDEAYTGLRRILNPESYLQYLTESRHFLSLPDDQKNREIQSWLETSTFKRYLDDVDPEDE